MEPDLLLINCDTLSTKKQSFVFLQIGLKKQGIYINIIISKVSTPEAKFWFFWGSKFKVMLELNALS